LKDTKRLGPIDDIFYKFGLAALAAIAAAVLLYVFTGINLLFDFKNPCLFYELTGLYCPGCGGTRAVRALVRGDIWQSFINYPVVLYMLVIFPEFMIRCFLRKHFKGNFGPTEDGKILPFIYVGLAIALVQWVAKLVAIIFFDYSWIV